MRLCNVYKESSSPSINVHIEDNIQVLQIVDLSLRKLVTNKLLAQSHQPKGHKIYHWKNSDEQGVYLCTHVAPTPMEHSSSTTKDESFQLSLWYVYTV